MHASRTHEPRTIAEWRQAWHEAGRSAQPLIDAVRALRARSDPAWIHLATDAQLREQTDALAARAASAPDDELPLAGVPFAVKDNIDIAGWPTTAACPAFAYTATHTATVVRRLIDAGAIAIGKTNLDQFATGLVGTRSPYGAVPNPFDARYISGGSSSGSASVVARGLVAFALGTDTAGSGRVPAGLNNLVGLKPTRGRFSTTGVVPACRTLDCVSVFATTVGDAATVAARLAAFDPGDPFSRRAPAAAVGFDPRRPRVGVPAAPEFFGDDTARAAWDAACDGLRAMGATLVPFDTAPLHEVTRLLYEGPWVAERHLVVKALLDRDPQAVLPVIREIVASAEGMTADDAFAAQYRLADLARRIETIWLAFDLIAVPTAPSAFTLDAVQADPIRLNSRLGHYTNFVNLLDWSALALPSARRTDGLPAGITLLAPAWGDDALVAVGRHWQQARPWPLGDSTRLPTTDAADGPATGQAPSGFIRVAVVGAHLTGMPLNHQLTSRHATFVEQTRTAPMYRLYALRGTVPPKPGLLRVGEGEPIIVELWDVPAGEFGGFVAEIPPPLGIGTLELIDGRLVKGFICEPIGLDDAEDITRFGGWRAFIAAQSAAAAQRTKGNDR